MKHKFVEVLKNIPKEYQKIPWQRQTPMSPSYCWHLFQSTTTWQGFKDKLPWFHCWCTGKWMNLSDFSSFSVRSLPCLVTDPVTGLVDSWCIGINSMLLILGENENDDIAYMLLMTMHKYAVVATWWSNLWFMQSPPPWSESAFSNVSLINLFDEEFKTVVFEMR